MKITKSFTGSMLLGALFTLSACTTGGTANQQDSKANAKVNLPENATLFISSNYADQSIDTVIVDDNNYEVKIGENVELEFNGAGQWIEVEDKELGKNENFLKNELPVRLVTYLNTNNPNQPIRKVEHKSRAYVVTLSKPHTTLVFFRDGHLSPTPKKLPSLANVYIQKYLPGDTVSSKLLDDEQIYEVEMGSGIYLEFDRMGNFERMNAGKVELPAEYTASLPKQMVKYITANYANRNIKKVIRKNYGYYVKLGKDKELKDQASKSVELRFSKTGDFLRNANQSEDDD